MNEPTRREQPPSAMSWKFWKAVVLGTAKSIAALWTAMFAIRVAAEQAHGVAATADGTNLLEEAAGLATSLLNLALTHPVGVVLAHLAVAFFWTAIREIPTDRDRTAIKNAVKRLRNRGKP